jgi:hypothetical protein
MSKKFKHKGKNWSIDVTFDWWTVFLIGMVAGVLVGKL